MANIHVESTWTAIKNLVDDRGTSLHHTETDLEYRILTINGPIIYEVVLVKDTDEIIVEDVAQNNTDLADFEANYKSNSNQKERVPVDASFQSDQELDVNVVGGTSITKHKLIRWSSGNISIGSGSWTDVYTTTETTSLFLGCVFHTNTDKIDFRIVVDGDTVIDLDLDEMKDDFVLTTGGGADDSDSGGGSYMSRSVGCIGLREYDKNRWAYCPPIPIRFSTNVKIQMKSQSGNKKIYRAMTSLGSTT